MKNNLLDFALKTIEAVPQVIRYLSPVYKSQEYFLTQITGLVRGVYGGFIGGDFIDTMANLISGQLWDAYQSAWFDEGGSGELPEYLQASYQAAVANQYAFVDGFYRNTVDARIDGTPITPLLARAELWAQRWLESYNEAVRLITIDGGGNLVWQLGATEEHCPECAALNGLVMSAKQWNQIGVRPQNAPNKSLTCGGWRCDCSLSPTDKRRSPNAYGRAEEILLAKK